MPELPEVDALVADLRRRTAGAVVAEIEPASFTVVKTVDPPYTSLHGLPVTTVRRHGKLIDLEAGGLHLVIHLARAGWIRWSDDVPSTRVSRRGPIVLRVRLDAGSGPHLGFDLTEAGTHKAVAAHIVRDPRDIALVAELGPDALNDDYDLALLLNRPMQIKRLLRDQRIVAGIGNAYSDEILHQAHLSPFAIASKLDHGELERLRRAISAVLGDAVARAHTRPPGELKDQKRSHLRVHGRTGAPCPVCGDTIAEVRFSDSSLQYCPACQTDGRLLKDRSTSKFLK